MCVQPSRFHRGDHSASRAGPGGERWCGGLLLVSARGHMSTIHVTWGNALASEDWYDELQPVPERREMQSSCLYLTRCSLVGDNLISLTKTSPRYGISFKYTCHNLPSLSQARGTLPAMEYLRKSDRKPSSKRRIPTGTTYRLRRLTTTTQRITSCHGAPGVRVHWLVTKVLLCNCMICNVSPSLPLTREEKDVSAPLNQ